MTIGLGFIGVGNHGRHHLHEFSRLPGAAPRLVCDLNPAHVEAAQRDFPGTTAADAATLVASPAIDAVVICTPAESHRALVELALAHGRHVLVEKPLAHDPADARAIAALAAAHPDRVVMVGHCERFNRAYLDARRAVTDGEVGTPRFIAASRLSPLHLNNRAWRLGPLDTAVHDIDLILWLMGDRPVSVTARAAERATGAGWDHVTYDIRFAGGALAQGHIGWVDFRNGYPLSQNAHPRLFLDGTGGSLTVNLWQRPVAVHNNQANRYFWPDEVVIGYGDYATVVTAADAAFLQAIAHGGPSPMPAADAATALAVAHAAWQSAREDGRTIPLPPPAP
ncbi:MAG: Gfo/Idh/MocA family oxidoreductase [Opitutaceae bacterium]|nr:Gfo/Idh/MocA family oxidoreductase [Opitutaceae bacterium]